MRVLWLLMLHEVWSSYPSRWNWRFVKSLPNQKTQSTVAKHFVVSWKTIWNVISKKERGVEIAKYTHSRCQLKFEQDYKDVSEATCKWLLLMPGTNGEVQSVESVVCAKSMRLANLLNKPNFKASKWMFACWKNRYEFNIYKVRNIEIQVERKERSTGQQVDLQKFEE